MTTRSSSNSSNCNEFAIGASSALNNMAVDMLKRQCYQQAFETLKDCMLVMKLTAAITEDQFLAAQGEQQEEALRQKENARSHRHFIHTKLTLASQRITHEDAMPLFPYIAMEVFSHDTLPPLSTLHSIATTESLLSTDKALSLISIHDGSAGAGSWCSQNSVERLQGLHSFEDENLVTAIVFHNFAVAHLCGAQHVLVAQSTGEEWPTETAIRLSRYLQKCAVKLLLSARSLLQQRYDYCLEKDDDDDHDLALGQLVFLSLVFLQTLIRALSAGGQVKAANSCRGKLQLLIEAYRLSRYQGEPNDIGDNNKNTKGHKSCSLHHIFQHDAAPAA